MVSSRYALPVLLCFLLALVPTIIHSYIGLVDEDGKTVTAIALNLGAYSAEPTQRETQWVKHNFGADDWIERIYVCPEGSQIRLFAARSYDNKRLYHHPELALSYGYTFGSPQLIRFASKPYIPVFVLTNNQGEWAAYMLIHDNNFVAHPVLHQILNSIRNMLHSRQKLTILYASGSFTSNLDSLKNSHIIQVLWLSLDSFLMQTQKTAVVH